MSLWLRVAGGVGGPGEGGGYQPAANNCCSRKGVANRRQPTAASDARLRPPAGAAAAAYLPTNTFTHPPDGGLQYVVDDGAVALGQQRVKVGADQVDHLGQPSGEGSKAGQGEGSWGAQASQSSAQDGWEKAVTR